MSMHPHAVAVPTLVRALSRLRHVLAKGEAHAQAQGWDPAVVLGLRLAPDMLPLLRQAQIATDLAKNAAGRLTGTQAPAFEDTETTFAQLDARLQRAIDYLESVPAEGFDDAATRAVSVPARNRADLRFEGADYLLSFVLPNVHFHCAIAYAVLRNAGVPLGKADFIGPVGMQD